MKLFFFCLLALLNCAGASSQSTQKKNTSKGLQYFSLAATNSHTAMPCGSFAALFYEEFHPGVEMGTGLSWSEKKKHDWFQTLKLGYSYHRFVQHSLMLYTEVGYRYKFPKGFAANAKLGGGYLFSKEDSKVFVLNSKGEYEQSEKFGRSHGMATLSLGVNKEIGKKGLQLFMDYQQRFQLSFIAAYVPALPVNTFGFGLSIPLHKK